MGSSVSFYSSVLCIYTEISQELSLCKTLIRLQREINVIDCGSDIKYQAFLLLIKNMAKFHSLAYFIVRNDPVRKFSSWEGK